MKQLSLSFHDRVIFVDWHGVLSRDRFWLSITNKTRHPLRSQLNTKATEIFSQSSVIDEWMRGEISSQEIIGMMQVKTDQRFRSDFLARRLISDCACMKVDEELAQFLKHCKQRATIVLATDNMDCFAAAFEQARNKGRKHRGSMPEQDMRDFAPVFDDIVCSSDVGVLKAEDAAKFFGELLDEYDMDFRDALLIDDRQDNCEAFRQQGGSAYRWTGDNLHDFRRLVSDWLKIPGMRLFCDAATSPVTPSAPHLDA